jgi:hypothetical protein
MSICAGILLAVLFLIGIVVAVEQVVENRRQR